MFGNYIKIAWRNLWRRKLFTTVNILGLAIGLTCVAFLFLCVQQMLTRDRFHAHLDRLFLVQTGNDAQQSVFPLLDVMLKDFPQVASGTRISTWDAPWIAYKDKELNEQVTYVDTGFFNVFTFPLKYGNAATALKEKASIVLSAEVADKLFGQENPLGKVVAFADKRRFTVTGVMQPIAPNASLKPAVLLSNKYLTDDDAEFKQIADWYNNFTGTYVLLRSAADKAAVEKLLKKDVRFNKEQVLTVNLDLDFKDTALARSGVNYIIEQLRQHASVNAVSTSQCIPSRFWENYNTFLPDDGANKELGMRQVNIDEGFLPAFGIRLLEGRNFSADMVTDDQAVLINQTTMKALGWTSIEGKTLRPKGAKQSFRVIGVTDDYHYRSLEGNIQPLIHFYAGKTGMREGYHYLNINIKPKYAAPVITLLKQAFSKIPSRREFTYVFADELFNEQYKSIEGILGLISFFTIVSVFIACAGIFALVALAAQQRTREIGIRKVLGASIGSIVALLSKDLMKLVCIAIILAAPLAWWLMNRWLQDFAYRITIPWWLLAGAGMIAIIIALLTVSVQSVKAALMNPTKALRTE